MKKISVSIIVPVYNVEPYLTKCLDSLVHQSLNNIEIIIVNDGSPDNSQLIIDKYAKKYPKIIKSFKKKNGGLSDARNFGIERASGEYIAFLDADDYVREDTYELMYNKAKNFEFDVVACDLYYVYSDHMMEKGSNLDTDIFSDRCLRNAFLNIYPVVWNKIYKRSIFEDNNLRFKKNVWFEDVEFTYKYLPYIKSIGVIKENLIYYVQRKGSISNTYDKRIYDEVYNWNGLISYYKDNDLFDKYKKELEYAYVRYIYGSFIKQCSNFDSKCDYLDAVDFAIKNRKVNFPNYRKNKAFYTNGLKGIYLICFNKIIAKIYYLIKKVNQK